MVLRWVAALGKACDAAWGVLVSACVGCAGRVHQLLMWKAGAADEGGHPEAASVCPQC